MSGTSRSRETGKSRSFKPEQLREPETAALDKLDREKASIKSEGSLSSQIPEQMADQSGELLEQVADPPDGLLDKAVTTTGEGKPAPIAEELKQTIRAGVHIGQSNKLDPSAPTFIPSNSNLPNVTNTMTGSVFSKHMTFSTSTSSRLNPDSKEFVPSGFSQDVPVISIPNGDSYRNGDFFEEEEFLEPKDIVRGFERAAPTESGDYSSVPIMKAGAEILLKMYYYPGSFNELGSKFQEALKLWTPSDSTLTNLAEMLIHWGINAPYLRYTACRVCHQVSEMEHAENFKKLLVARLQPWHERYNHSLALATDVEKSDFINYCGFFAELYAKIKIKGEPVNILGTCVLSYIEKLLNLKSDYSVREACNILKLTGCYLQLDEKNSEKMACLRDKMKVLALDNSLSKTCTGLILQVIELYGSNWDCTVSPVLPPADPVTPFILPVDLGNQLTEGVSRLNTNAAPFVPSEPFIPTETFYEPQITQQPVTSAEEWYEFVGEDQPIEGCDDRIDLEDEDEYDGLDPEIELEMEAFIDEIEEHLMLQDFDPELHGTD